MARSRVYVQVQNLINGKWANYKSFATYDDAVVGMRELQTKYPDAKLRILDKANGTTHTY